MNNEKETEQKEKSQEETVYPIFHLPFSIPTFHPPSSNSRAFTKNRLASYAPLFYIVQIVIVLIPF